MIEIRTYEGSVEDLQRFVVGVWSADYSRRMAFPLWPADYLDWQLGISDGVPRSHLVAAYEGTKLVGCVLGAPYDFRIPSGVVAGTHGSWLSIDPDYRRQGVGSKLKAGMIQRHADEGRLFQVGYRYFGSRFSLGRHIWREDSDSPTQFLGTAGFWVRILDPLPAASWNLGFFDRWMIRMFATLGPRPKPVSSGAVIRPYRSADLPRCLELMRAQTEKSAISIDWDADSLGRMLDGRGVGKCLVAEQNGKVQGFTAFHVIPFRGRTDAPVGVIDVICEGFLAARERRALVAAALVEMKNLGAVLALKLRIGDYCVGSLLKNGFIPRAADSHILITWAAPRVPISTRGRKHLLWR